MKHSQRDLWRYYGDLEAKIARLEAVVAQWAENFTELSHHTVELKRRTEWLRARLDDDGEAWKRG